MWETSGEAESETTLCPLACQDEDVYSFWLLLWWDTFFQSLFWNPNTACNLSAEGSSLYHSPFSLSFTLSVLMNTIAQAASCCRHFVADHGAERPAAFYCLIVHFMVHIAHSPFVSRPLVHLLFLLTPSFTNHNKSNTHLFQLMADSSLPTLLFQLERGVRVCVSRARLDAGSAAAVGIGLVCVDLL